VAGDVTALAVVAKLGMFRAACDDGSASSRPCFGNGGHGGRQALRARAADNLALVVVVPVGIAAVVEDLALGAGLTATPDGSAGGRRDSSLSCCADTRTSGRCTSGVACT